MSYQFPGNANIQRAAVTINHGANIAAQTVQDATVAVSGVTTNDRVSVNPAASVAGIIVGAPRVSGAGTVAIPVANITTATVAAGTAAVYNLQIFKA